MFVTGPFDGTLSVTGFQGVTFVVQFFPSRERELHFCPSTLEIYLQCDACAPSLL